MGYETDLRNIQAALQNLADLQQQERAWRSPDTIYFPAPLELIVMLLDDCQFSDFLTREIAPRDNDLRRRGEELIEKLKSYPDDNLDDPEVILSDPDWAAIREIAAEVHERLSNLATKLKIN
jgi:hypothetical protein